MIVEAAQPAAVCRCDHCTRAGVGAIPTVMVSTSGFSVAAKNHLEAEEIGHLTITLKQAQGLRWIPLVEEKFSVDRGFRHVSGDLVEALRKGDASPFIDSDLPYEEWLAVIRCGQDFFPTSTAKVLKTGARALRRRCANQRGDVAR